jgi:hypothetical protein
MLHCATQHRKFERACGRRVVGVQPLPSDEGRTPNCHGQRRCCTDNVNRCYHILAVAFDSTMADTEGTDPLFESDLGAAAGAPAAADVVVDV